MAPTRVGGRWRALGQGCLGLARCLSFPEVFLTSELFPDNCGLCGQVKEVVQKTRLAPTGSSITRGPCGFVTSAL